MAAHIHQFLCLKDNFGVLVHDPRVRTTASIDAPEAGPVLAALAAREWELTDILITHHHVDHVQGIAGLKAKYPRARVIGPAKEATKIGGLDLAIGEGDVVVTGALEAKVIEVPGHTVGPRRLLVRGRRHNFCRRHAVCDGLRPRLRGAPRGAV